VGRQGRDQGLPRTQRVGQHLRLSSGSLNRTPPTLSPRGEGRPVHSDSPVQRGSHNMLHSVRREGRPCATPSPAHLRLGSSAWYEGTEVLLPSSHHIHNCTRPKILGSVMPVQRATKGAAGPESAVPPLGGRFPQDAKPAESRTQPVLSPYLRHFSFTFTRLLTHKGTATLQASK